MAAVVAAVMAAVMAAVCGDPQRRASGGARTKTGGSPVLRERVTLPRR
jgi:hypothetical protein